MSRTDFRCPCCNRRGLVRGAIGRCTEWEDYFYSYACLFCGSEFVNELEDGESYPVYVRWLKIGRVTRALIMT